MKTRHRSGIERTNVAAFVNNFVPSNKFEKVKKKLKGLSMIERKSVVNMKFDGSYPVIRACEVGNLEMVKYLVEECGSELNVYTWPLSVTPVGISCATGNLQLLEYLASRGASLNFQNSKGITYLMESVENTAVSEFLISNGVDVHLKDRSGKTALDYAIESQATKIVLRLIHEGIHLNVNAKLDCGLRPVSFACAASNIDLLQVLLKHGGGVNFIDRKGQNYLMRFITRYGICKCLLAHGINVNKVDKHRRTAIFYAISRRKLNVIKLLVKNGANVNVADDEGLTPLHLAVTNSNSKKIISFLVKSGAKIDIANKNGFTPVHLAIKGSKLEAVKCLHSLKAHVFEKFPDGKSMLHKAALLKEKKIVEYFINKGELTINQQIDGYELLAASYIRRKFNIVNDETSKDFEVAADLLCTAQDLRNNHGTYKEKTRICDVFDGITEPQSREEIMSPQWRNYREANVLATLIQARILGSYSEEVVWQLENLYQYGSQGDENECEQLKIALYLFKASVIKYGQTDINTLRACTKVIDSVTDLNKSYVKLDQILEAVGCFASSITAAFQTAVDSENAENLYNCCLEDLLFLIYRIMSLCRVTVNYHSYIATLHQLIKSLVNADRHYRLIFSNQKRNLLHEFIKSVWLSRGNCLDEICEETVEKILQIIIKCGVSVNTVDSEHRTPLHTLLGILRWGDENQSEIKTDNKVIQFLIDSGSHLDVEDECGICLLDLLNERGFDFCKVRDRSLQCLCSEVILQNEIQYKGCVVEFMEPFIEIHKRFEKPDEDDSFDSEESNEYSDDDYYSYAYDDDDAFYCCIQ